jgi:macrodomain Ter protein organizer (MatP/YcbG family)
MAKERYTITGADKRFVIRYLEERLRRDAAFWNTYVGGPALTAHLEEEEALRAIRDFAGSKSVEELNAWAEKYLDRLAWQRLKNAVRQGRRRAKRPEVKNVVLTHKAWVYLSDLSQRDGVTLSEVVEKYLHPVWRRHRGA